MNKTANGISLDRILQPVISSNDDAAQKSSVLRRTAGFRPASPNSRTNAQGELTPEEHREYETYLLANHFVAVLKAQARIILARKAESV